MRYASVKVSLSVDDGANWEPEEVVASTNKYGIFTTIIETDTFSASLFGQAILIRASYFSIYPKPVEIYKTAYLIVSLQPREWTYRVVRIRIPHLPIYLGSVRHLPYEMGMELPDTLGYRAKFIDATSLRLNGTVPVGPECVSYRDINGDSLLDLTLTINRTVLSQFILSRNMTTGNVTLFLTGRFYDNTLFGGSMLVTVRMPGDVNIDGRVDIKDLAQAAKSFGSYSDHPQWNPTSDENEDGKIDIRDLVLICKKFGTVYT
jgi:hypothetical protein